MPERNEQVAAAARAKDQLAAQLLSNPNVSLIDIGLDPQTPTGPLVLRVHLRSAAARKTVQIPDQVNGIPVRTIVADYQLE